LNNSSRQKGIFEPELELGPDKFAEEENGETGFEKGDSPGPERGEPSGEVEALFTDRGERTVRGVELAEAEENGEEEEEEE
jgi:hypothetical protein